MRIRVFYVRGPVVLYGDCPRAPFSRGHLAGLRCLALPSRQAGACFQPGRVLELLVEVCCRVPRFPNPHARQRPFPIRVAARQSLNLAAADFRCLNCELEQLVAGSALLPMNSFFPLDELAADEIEAAIAVSASETTLEHWLAVHDFLDRIGGLANAKLAIEVLRSFEAPS
jgi:hypothetical protein